MTVVPLVWVQLYWTAPSASVPEPDRETGMVWSTVRSEPASAIGGTLGTLATVTVTVSVAEAPSASVTVS